MTAIVFVSSAYVSCCQNCRRLAPEVLMPHPFRHMQTPEYAASASKPGVPFFREGTYLCRQCAGDRVVIGTQPVSCPIWHATITEPKRVILDPDWNPCLWCRHPEATHVGDICCLVPGCDCPMWD
jgi:hypothetical protein